MHRTQILFPYWLNEYIDMASKKCSISKGEMIRCMTSLGILMTLKAQGKGSDQYDKLFKTFETIQKNCDDMDSGRIAEFHDSLFHETRKAIENK